MPLPKEAWGWGPWSGPRERGSRRERKRWHSGDERQRRHGHSRVGLPGETEQYSEAVQVALLHGPKKQSRVFADEKVSTNARLGGSVEARRSMPAWLDGRR